MKSRTGDYGHRYEVTFLDADGVRKIFGWAEDPKAFIHCINLHPTMSSPEVTDRDQCLHQPAILQRTGGESTNDVNTCTKCTCPIHYKSKTGWSRRRI